MNSKVRAFGSKTVKYRVKIDIEIENIQKMRQILAGIERESIRGMIMKANMISDSIKSEGKLAKEINFSDFRRNDSKMW